MLWTSLLAITIWLLSESLRSLYRYIFSVPLECTKLTVSPVWHDCYMVYYCSVVAHLPHSCWFWNTFLLNVVVVTVDFIIAQTSLAVFSWLLPTKGISACRFMCGNRRKTAVAEILKPSDPNSIAMVKVTEITVFPILTFDINMICILCYYMIGCLNNCISDKVYQCS